MAQLLRFERAEMRYGGKPRVSLPGFKNRTRADVRPRRDDFRK
jgi:hypothetical protein